jgi:hypothetical protein
MYPVNITQLSMPPRKKSTPASQKTSAKHFTFQLSLQGVAGIALVTSCLFLWMFFIGIWAGKTILSPCPSTQLSPCPSTPFTAYEPITDEKNRHDTQEIYLEASPSDSSVSSSSEIYVQPRERKKRISPP